MKLRATLATLVLGASLWSCEPVPPQTTTHSSPTVSYAEPVHLYNVDSFNRVLDKQFGFDDVRLIKQGSLSTEERTELKRFVPFFSTRGGVVERNKQEFLSPVAKYKYFSCPRALQIDNEYEIIKVKKDFQKISYAHYALGENGYWVSSSNLSSIVNFPYDCCGQSSMNVTMSAFHYGYLNVVSAVDKNDDHVVVIIPVLYKKQEMLLVCDPTSNQLYFYDERSVYNDVFLLPRNGLYKTHWKGGNNLYPERVSSYNCWKFDTNDYWNVLLIDEYLDISYDNPCTLEDLPIKSY
jgi:hypothetical protein